MYYTHSCTQSYDRGVGAPPYTHNCTWCQGRHVIFHFLVVDHRIWIALNVAATILAIVTLPSLIRDVVRFCYVCKRLYYVRKRLCQDQTCSVKLVIII